MISAEARAAHRYAMTMTFAPREIENVVHDDALVGVVGFHSIGWVNVFVVETFEINRVRAVNRDFAVIDVPRDGIDQVEILVLVITAERSWKQNQRQTAAITEREHLKLATEPGRVPLDVTFVHLLKITRQD